MVINISRRYHKVEKLSLLIANQVQFETEKPTHRAFSSLSYVFENFVNIILWFLQTRSGMLSTKLIAVRLFNRTFLINKAKRTTTSLPNSTKWL